MKKDDERRTSNLRTWLTCYKKIDHFPHISFFRSWVGRWTVMISKVHAGEMAWSATIQIEELAVDPCQHPPLDVPQGIFVLFQPANPLNFSWSWPLSLFSFTGKALYQAKEQEEVVKRCKLWSLFVFVFTQDHGKRKVKHTEENRLIRCQMVEACFVPPFVAGPALSGFQWFELSLHLSTRANDDDMMWYLSYLCSAHLLRLEPMSHVHETEFQHAPLMMSWWSSSPEMPLMRVSAVNNNFDPKMRGWRDIDVDLHWTWTDPRVGADLWNCPRWT